MRAKKGRNLHSEGGKPPSFDGEAGRAAGYADELASALRRDMMARRAALKDVMRWTGASERTVKAWLGGISTPSGGHLIALVRHSDVVFTEILRLSGRLERDRAAELEEVQRHLATAGVALGRAIARRG